MQITRRVDIEELVLDEMRRSFAKPRDGIHLSDLLNPRWAYWQRTKPKPISNDEVGYFLAGRGHEDIYAQVADFTKGQARLVDGVWFTVDFAFNIPAEFKTRRRNLAKDGEETETYSTYIEQVRGYCALANRPAAWLFVMSLVEQQGDGSTRPAMGAYLLEFTPEELVVERARITTRRLHLEAALRGDLEHRLLPLCWAFKCGRSSRRMTTKPHCVTCDRDFEGEWGANKHMESKKGKGHVVKPAEYTVYYEKKCRWYEECRPDLDDASRGGQAPPPVSEPALAVLA